MHTLFEPWTARGLSPADAYRATFPPRLSPAQRRFVESRLAHPARGADPLDGLVAGANPEVFGWMVRKARLADHTKPGLPVADARAVVAEITARRARGADTDVAIGSRRRRSAWDRAEVALLHDLAGETFSAIARRRDLHESYAYRLYEEHRVAIGADRAYGDIAADLARSVIEQQHRSSGLDPKALVALLRRLRPPDNPAA